MGDSRHFDSLAMTTALPLEADIATAVSGRIGRLTEVNVTIMMAFHSVRLLTLRTHARTSASTSGNIALTSCTVMPALIRGS